MLESCGGNGRAQSIVVHMMDYNKVTRINRHSILADRSLMARKIVQGTEGNKEGRHAFKVATRDLWEFPTVVRARLSHTPTAVVRIRNLGWLRAASLLCTPEPLSDSTHIGTSGTPQRR